MRCPVHVAVEMEIVVGGRPHFSVAGGDDQERQQSRLRRFWRCTVPGCRQVSQILDDAFEPERRKCRKCGVNDADPILAASGYVSCKQCRLSKQTRNNHAKETHRLAQLRGSRRATAAAMAANAHRRGQSPRSKENLKRGAAGRPSSQRGVARLPVGSAA